MKKGVGCEECQGAVGIVAGRKRRLLVAFGPLSPCGDATGRVCGGADRRHPVLHVTHCLGLTVSHLLPSSWPHFATWQGGR